MVRILLADDNEIMRTGLKLLINNLVTDAVIDEAGDGNSTFRKVKENPYQLIILDVNMPGTDSFELVSKIIGSRPDTKILIFSMNAEDVYAIRYLKAGAKGYVSKDAPAMEVEKAIDTVLKGMRYISTALRYAIALEILGEKTKNPFDILSSREFEIVQHLIKGESLSGICQTFNLKASTVSTHKARIFKKLNCNNIIELNQLATINNIISPA